MFDPQKYRAEKEKEIKSVYGSLRKRSFRFLFLNILMVILIFTFVFFIQRVSPQTYSNIVENLQLVIEMTKVEFKSPEKINARVYIVNTRKTAKSFVISDFYIKVYSPQKTLYEFSYPSAIESTVDGLSKRLIYDLGKEVTLSNLSGGNYTIHVRCKINGRDAQIYRNFTYTEQIYYEIATEPFYLVNESINPKIVIKNRTSKLQNIQINKITWKCKDKEYTQHVKKQINLYPGEIEIIESEYKFSVEENKDSELGASIHFKDNTIRDIKILVPVTRSLEKDTKGLDFSIEAEESVIVNQIPKLNVFVINQQNSKRYLYVDKISFSISNIGYNFEIGNRRFFLIPFGKTFITKLERLKFNEPGVYEMLITISSGNSKYQKKITIAVGR
ncbi:MAG: hypothetical protein N2Z58_00680 [Fervidobacterium sp.]|nr:hypothetical protein [Fervidobacterium sp.]